MNQRDACGAQLPTQARPQPSSQGGTSQPPPAAPAAACAAGSAPTRPAPAGAAAQTRRCQGRPLCGKSRSCIAEQTRVGVAEAGVEVRTLPGCRLGFGCGPGGRGRRTTCLRGKEPPTALNGGCRRRVRCASAARHANMRDALTPAFVTSTRNARHKNQEAHASKSRGGAALRPPEYRDLLLCQRVPVVAEAAPYILVNQPRPPRPQSPDHSARRQARLPGARRRAEQQAPERGRGGGEARLPARGLLGLRAGSGARGGGVRRQRAVITRTTPSWTETRLSGHVP
jgi:hypothetical protein